MNSTTMDTTITTAKTNISSSNSSSSSTTPSDNQKPFHTINSAAAAADDVEEGEYTEENEIDWSREDGSLNNQKVLSSLDTQSHRQTNDDFFFISEKFTYSFDFPNQSQVGYVESQNNRILIIFPEQWNFNHVQTFPYTQKVQLILNNKRCLSYDWLPIYSVNDFFRVKDMFSKSFLEYVNKTEQNQFMLHKKAFAHAKQFSEQFTVCETKYFVINCIEDAYNSSISVNFKLDNLPLSHLSPCSTEPVHVQIVIGGNLVFCTQRDILKSVGCVRAMTFLTQFILHKLIKI